MACARFLSGGPRASGTAAAFAAFALALAACAPESSPQPSPESSPYKGQRAFADPSSAVEALAAAARNGDMAALEAILGPDAREVLSSGDAVADRMNREVFVVALNEAWTLESAGESAKELVIGHEQWPFPIPLVKERHGWWFDTAAGKQEVLARRIGRNELAAIGVLRTYGIAQRKYASDGRDGKPAGIYAQKVRSEPGKHDGLFWPTTAPGEKPSPLGDLAAQAAAEGYSAESRGPKPFHGYFYRILTRQGKDAPGGAKSYVVGSDMKEGFAMVAHPAEYGNSGIMTFQVGPDGIIYESDLGENTAKAAVAITEYNPDSAWHKVE